MLSTLHIENYVLIKQSDISFDDSFVVITGETGAGKSILLGALGLLLGGRADCQVLYDKERKCCVEAVFDISGLHLQPFFEHHDIDYDPLLIIRREILPSAKSRAFVNDTPVPLSLLKELGAQLIDIHSQHETLLLNDSSFRIKLLDSPITHSPDGRVLQQYSSAFSEYVRQKQELERLTSQDQQNRKEADYLQFLFDELDNAHLVEDEQSSLEEESQLLTNAEEIKQTFATIEVLCDDDEQGAVSRMNSSHALLSKIANCHKDIAHLDDRLESCLIELRDLIGELSSLNESIDFSPERQLAVDERLDLIYRLEKKHSVESVAQLIAIRDDLGRQLAAIASMDDQIRQAMEAVDRTFDSVQRLANTLSDLRRKNAQKVESHVLPLLQELGMKDASFNILVNSTAEYGPYGCDKVEIRFSANKGSEPCELSKVASGGEMSRVMLALKSFIAHNSQLPTVVFDEIDTGISGDISLKTGRILRQMSMQVIAISHTPQIAALAHQHLKVYKSVEDAEDKAADSRTVSHIKRLDEAERILEIAQMLSSEHPSEAALQTAKELLDN